ncbi:hypothetical protein CCP3SC5AM1_1080005 [Gammaproteobacteria bacterium]
MGLLILFLGYRLKICGSTTSIPKILVGFITTLIFGIEIGIFFSQIGSLVLIHGTVWAYGCVINENVNATVIKL